MSSPATSPTGSEAARPDARGPALLPHVGEDPCGVTGEVAHQVEIVSAQHHEIFAAGPSILLAPRADFHQGAQLTAAQHLAYSLRARHQAIRVADLYLDATPLRHGHHGVGLFQSAREGLFRQDVRSHFRSRCQHGQTLLGPAHTEGHYVGLFLSQHFAIVGISSRRAAPGHGAAAAAFIRIGHGHHLRFWHGLPRQVPIVAVVPTAGVTDEDHTVSLRPRCLSIKHSRRPGLHK